MPFIWVRMFFIFFIKVLLMLQKIKRGGGVGECYTVLNKQTLEYSKHASCLRNCTTTLFKTKARERFIKYYHIFNPKVHVIRPHISVTHILLLYLSIVCYLLSAQWSTYYRNLKMYVCVYLCVCVWERDRERESTCTSVTRYKSLDGNRSWHGWVRVSRCTWMHYRREAKLMDHNIDTAHTCV